MSAILKAIPETLLQLRELGILRDIDLYLVEALDRRCAQGTTSAAGLLAAALANRTLSDAHICLKLTDLTPDWLSGLAPGDDLPVDRLPPGVAGLLEQIHSGGLTGESNALIAVTATNAPFVLDKGRLYLRRYWLYERRVADKLRALAGHTEEIGDHPDFGSLSLNKDQTEAVRRALQRRLLVISGGPGTGKTYTAARILYLLASRRANSGQPFIIRMAAPTGKAADRLNASVGQALDRLGSDIRYEEACTIERLLGFVSCSPYFRHDRDNPLPADLVLVDEASMIDLPKMAKLLDALAEDCRLILLGDMHQLASVAPGSVLGDICASAALSDSLIELGESRRFQPGGAIAELSAAINAAATDADAERSWELLQSCAAADGVVELRETPERLVADKACADAVFAEDIIRGYADFTAAVDPASAFAALDNFRVLCAMRRGRHGIEKVNALIEKILSGQAVQKDGLPPELSGWRRLQCTGEFYDHRVIMVTRNDYGMRLFNGDVGIVLPDPDRDEPGALAVYFRKGVTADASGFRKIACRLLPEHETAFAITVHKSQGSEFEQVLVLLPLDAGPVVSKELVYTAITRCRSSVKLYCREESFKEAIIKKTERSTGLRGQLGGYCKKFYEKI
jgi:exodeoxyribonuclease V alpha subunit